LDLKQVIGEILEKDRQAEEAETSDDEIVANENLKGIAGDILTETPRQQDSPSPEVGSHLVQIVGEVIGAEESAQEEVLSDADKLQVIKSLADLFIDLRLEPQFQLSWLLAYTQALEKLNADSYLRAAFARWAWTSLAELKAGADELAEVAPEAMVQLAGDMANDYEWFRNDTAKVRLCENCKKESNETIRRSLIYRKY